MLRVVPQPAQARRGARRAWLLGVGLLRQGGRLRHAEEGRVLAEEGVDAAAPGARQGAGLRLDERRGDVGDGGRGDEGGARPHHRGGADAARAAGQPARLPGRRDQRQGARPARVCAVRARVAAPRGELPRDVHRGEGWQAQLQGEASDRRPRHEPELSRRRARPIAASPGLSDARSARPLAPLSPSRRARRRAEPRAPPAAPPTRA